MSADVLQELVAVLESRKHADPDSSYVASLYAKGPDAVLKKVGEEAAEVLIAAKNGETKSAGAISMVSSLNIRITFFHSTQPPPRSVCRER